MPFKALSKLCVLSALLVTAAASSQSYKGDPETRAIRAFDLAKGNPLKLHAFLMGMPKGADLHMHLSGAVYAETFIADAAEDKLCVDLASLSLVKSRGVTSSHPPRPVCGEGQTPAATAFEDQRLYDRLVDSFSMRGFVPSSGISGHDQFFSTFSRFGGISKSHGGEWIDEVAQRAAAQNEQYLEIMQTPEFSKAATLGAEAGWPVGADGEPRDATRMELSEIRNKLLTRGLREELAADVKELDEALKQRESRERCRTPQAESACSVEVRFLAQVLRAFPPQQVFAQTLLYFELASADPNVVGINFVQPEDAYLSMREYHRQMLMLDYLHTVYPKVRITLHAGELAPGLVRPDGLTFHIREAVELGHAERIGHGVDAMYEVNPKTLLREMANRHVMVEINLTSNDVILGVKANWHSLPEYLEAGVPVALSTDDEGVSRIDLTHEYTRAAMDFHLGYPDLKRMARTGVEHSFLPGESLWLHPDDFRRTRAECAGGLPGSESPSSSCREFLRKNERAAQEWELEHRFHTFEASLP